MNWDAVGAMAEAIASIGVIISLVYLVRHDRKMIADNNLATGGELENREILARITQTGVRSTCTCSPEPELSQLTRRRIEQDVNEQRRRQESNQE